MTDLADFGQIYYLEISLNNNMYTHTSLIINHHTRLSKGSKNKLASVILQLTKNFKTF